MKFLKQSWVAFFVVAGVITVVVVSLKPRSIDPMTPRLEPAYVDFGEMDQLTHADAIFHIVNPTDWMSPSVAKFEARCQCVQTNW